MQTRKDPGKNPKRGLLAVSKWKGEGRRACLKHRGVFYHTGFLSPSGPHGLATVNAVVCGGKGPFTKALTN